MSAYLISQILLFVCFYKNLKDIFITVGFKANILINYLKNHIKNVKIRFASERIPLGTLGGIKKLQEKIKNNFIVINCDTLLEISFLDLYSSHLNTNNLITIVAANHDLKINYGTFDLSRKGEVLDIIEKPQTKYLLNTGCYIVNKSALRYVPKNKYFNLTDLIKILVQKKKKIGLFTISKYLLLSFIIDNIIFIKLLIVSSFKFEILINLFSLK
jgi:NDP-sugar pyrophosphorylase family protein